MEKKQYILMNGKTISMVYDDTYDPKKGIVKIVGRNECYTSRRYGVYSQYANMTYDTRIYVGGYYYDFHSDNILQAEGIAILGAFATLSQIAAISAAGKDTQMSYAVHFGETRKNWDCVLPI